MSVPNRLAREPSLYLRQHQDNPVDWYPWSDEALARARSEDRPIFLSVGYASCHWCHVMEHEVFEDEEVARFLNARFVSIKVDREERPDLDSVYMEAVQAISGRGGWPMSLFLTPEGRPIFAGTYFPKETFLDLADQVHRLFTTQRGVVEAEAARLRSRVAAQVRLSAGGAVDDALITQGIARARPHLDTVNGGFDGQQKFPTPPRWRFLLQRLRRAPDREIEGALRRTLDSMAAGGIYDHLGGGFHRYTVEPTWLIPHFEKMLYDNAQLATLYVEAAAILDEPGYAAVARDVLDYLLRDMRGEEGGFFASVDADSGGEEGSYYVWTPAEVAAVAGEDGAALSALLGVTEKGNFEGSNVLSRRLDPADAAVRLGRTPDQLTGLFTRWREPLRVEREKRTPPGLDRKIVTSWNGLAIEALARAALALDNERYAQAARTAAAFLRRGHRREDGSLVRASTDGRPAGAAILDDYAFLAGGLMTLFEATGELEHLDWARELVDRARAEFGDGEGRYYLSPASAAAPLGRPEELLDSVEPSGAAAMARALIRLAALTGERTYHREAELLLRAHGELLGQVGLEMAAWLEAADLLLGPFYEVVVAGDEGDPKAQRLVALYRELLPGHAVLIRIPAAGPTSAQLRAMPHLEGKVAPNGTDTAYVCELGSCQAPTSEPKVLRSQLLDGWPPRG